MISGFENKDYLNGFDKGYSKGWTDAIDECIEAIHKLNIEYAYPHTICNVLEQIRMINK